MKRAAKAVIEFGLLHAGPARFARLRHRQGALILAYHNIVPEGEAPGADRSLHLAQREFAWQLDHVCRHCAVVPMEDLLAGGAAGRRPLAAITFDDGYAGALTAGVSELARRGLPATVFIAPGCLDGYAFWWDSFVETNGAPLTDSTREYLLQQCGGTQASVNEWAARNLHQVDPPPCARAANLADLHRATRDGAIDYGVHTWSHPNLAVLPEERFAQELEAPLAWMVGQFRKVLPVLAFPYGRYTEQVLAALGEAGYRAGLGIQGGWMRTPSVPHPVVPRLNVSSGLSRSGFALRVAGLLE